MRARCTNPNATAYERYGGRGITVCERWDSFENFLADMGERPQDRTLDRINNEGNYEPANCRWATRMEQGRNQRAVRKRPAARTAAHRRASGMRYWARAHETITWALQRKAAT